MNLYEASEANDLERVQELLQNDKISINSKFDPINETALFAACRNGHLKVLKYLLAYVKDPVDVNVFNKKKKTALMIACTYEHIEVVNCLLECKSLNINLQDNQGKTALMGTNNIDIFRNILKHDQVDVNIQDNAGRTVLALSCWLNPPVVSILLQYHPQRESGKCDINLADNAGETPLHCAAACDDTGKIVRMLLQHGAKYNVRSYQRPGKLPIEKARRSQVRLGSAKLPFRLLSLDLIKLLLDRINPISPDDE